ncbi:pep-cterm sorting domain-containing protein [Anaeramoeba ignava]|uniref:Pep-cterm sorting domain-containing protein n=1 Tax=Anaeramoeba ignava TaxID=1746090 RepID=A0A9Q0R9F5_ANAIG|nr:pep-cterm sorting domain-containing protein [Anaeramoeba ignava]
MQEIKELNQQIFIKQIFESRKIKQFCDFEITTESNDTHFSTHKAILNSRSIFFQKLFENNPELAEFEIGNYSTNTIEKILDFIYSGDVNLTRDSVLEIWKLSEKLGLKGLHDLAECYLRTSVSSQNVVSVLEETETSSVPDLFNLYCDFAAKNFDHLPDQERLCFVSFDVLLKIVQNPSFNPKSQFDLLMLFVKWSRKHNLLDPYANLLDKQPEFIKDSISAFLVYVDFSQMNQKELAQVCKLNVLSENLKTKFCEEKKVEQNLDSEKNDQITNENQIPSDEKTQSNARNPFSDSMIVEDEKHKELLKKWIESDEFYENMNLGFQATRDGFDCKEFHEICDDHGESLALIKTKEGYIFGGYTEIGWVNSGQVDIADPKAFIFSLVNPKNFEPQKFHVQKKKEGQAVCYKTGCGPSFGHGHDIAITRDLKSGWTYFGFVFELPKGIRYRSKEAKEFFAGSFDKWEVEEIEVYFK